MGDKILVSTAYSNEVMVIYPERGTSEWKSFHSELTQDKRPIPAKTSAETINEFSDLGREAEKGVKFGPFYFDEENRLYWRFSREIGGEIGGSFIFKNVFTILDEELNQLIEGEVSIDPFSKKFFKDGKLWSYVNVEDELGFTIMDIKF